MIRYANLEDFAQLKEYDKHISESELRNSIRAGRVLVMYQGDSFTGWLRFGLFWDNIPFMNISIGRSVILIAVPFYCRKNLWKYF